MHAFTLPLLFGQTTTNMTMETVDHSTKTLSDTFTEVFQPMIQMAPNALAAVLILGVGYVIARVLSRLATVMCEKIGLQTAAERSGLADSMKHAGVGRSMPAIIGLIVFWLLMCVWIMAAFKVLGLVAVSDAMQGVVASSGQTSPLSSSVRVWSDTPYCKYSTLVGGGRVEDCAAAGRTRPSATTKLAAQATPKSRFASDQDRAFAICFFPGLDERQTIRLKPGQA